MVIAGLAAVILLMVGVGGTLVAMSAGSGLASPTPVPAAQLPQAGAVQATEAAVAEAPPVERSAPDVVAPAQAPQVPDPDDVRMVGDHLEIDGFIHFASGTDEILNDGSIELIDHIAVFARNHQDEIDFFRIIGHTDPQGDADANMMLSFRRAQAVADELKAHGLPDFEVIVEGKGETEPVCHDQTYECLEKNRRVEFIIH